MNATHRISSILNTHCLSSDITGIATFELSTLDLPVDIDLLIPTNLRLGHLAEKVVSQAIHNSSNYEMLQENVQITDGKQTIGELDFILQEKSSSKIIHVELAYKFYLLDPSISNTPIKNWIGPNRNDSLSQKLKKLKQKQFPLLHHPCSKELLKNINTDTVNQALCLLVSLFIPFAYKKKMNASYQNAIKGYYVNYEQFKSLDNSEKTYHLPKRKQWGIEPCENETWASFTDIQEYIDTNLAEKQAVLCWQKQGENYTSFFIVWW